MDINIERYVRIIGVITCAFLGELHAEDVTAGLVLHVVEPVEGYDTLFVHDLGLDGEVLGVAYNYDGGNALWMGPQGTRIVFTQPNWVQLTVVSMNDAGMVLGVGGARGDELPINNCYVWDPQTGSTRIISAGDKTFSPVDMNKRGEVSGAALWYVEGKTPRSGGGEGGEIPGGEEIVFVSQSQAFVAGPSGIKYHGITETYEWEGGGGTNTGSFGAWGLGLNSFGIVLGRQDSRWENDIGVSWPGGERLGPDNGDRYYADKINDLNEAAGYYQQYDAQQGRYVSLIPVLYKIGQQNSVRLPLLAGTSGGYAAALNDTGVVAGFCYGPEKTFPVMWTRSGTDWKVESLEPYLSGWSDVYLSRVGTNGSIVGAGMFEGEYRWFVLAAPGLQIAVDANRDGTTRFAGDPDVEDDPALSDKTTPEKPFRFWLNDDRDTPSGEANPGSRGGVVNSMDYFINGPRDLEDLSRLVLKLDGNLKSKLQGGGRLVVETTGGLKIRLFQSVAPPDLPETAYLTDPDVGLSQSLRPKGRIELQPNNLQNYITGTDYEAGKKVFLWEGVKPGFGTICVRLLDSKGGELDMGQVHVDLRPVRELFDHVRMTPQKGFPPPYETGGRVPQLGLEYVHHRTAPLTVEEQNNSIVFVHGWRLPAWERQNWSELMYKRLWHAGYKGSYSAFSWPTLASDAGLVEAISVGFFTYNPSEFRAFKAGSVLHGYLRNLRTAMPAGSRLGICAHSMGNVVAGEALRRGAPVDNYVMMQAALSASCWDDRDLLNIDQFTEAERRSYTPDKVDQMGYRGLFTGIRGVNVANFFNEQDFALRTGADQVVPRLHLGGLWEANNVLFKPQILKYRALPRMYGFWNSIPGIWHPSKRPEIEGHWVLERRLNDPHESMAYLARSRTRAVCGDGRTGFSGNTPMPNQPIQGRVDLNGFPYRFNAGPYEHSAEFTRSIQQRLVGADGFYTELLRRLTVSTQE